MLHLTSQVLNYTYDIFPTFQEALDQITSEPYACMVINNDVLANKLQDQIMSFKLSMLS